MLLFHNYLTKGTQNSGEKHATGKQRCFARQGDALGDCCGSGTRFRWHHL